MAFQIVVPCRKDRPLSLQPFQPSGEPHFKLWSVCAHPICESETGLRAECSEVAQDHID